jgi:hypothetical protein
MSGGARLLFSDAIQLTRDSFLMNGYLEFLKNLTEYQQRAEIGILAFRERWPLFSSTDPLLDERVLTHHRVAAFSQKLEVDPCSWKSDIRHDIQWAEALGSPTFHGDQCITPFSLRYKYLNQNLVVSGTTYVDDEGNTLVGIGGCDTAQSFESPARERLISLGIDPDTRLPITYHYYDDEMARNIPYFDWLRALLPGQQRDAIFDLIDQPTWLWSNPKYLDRPKLAAELKEHHISNLIFMDGARINIGPVDFSPGRCTVTLAFFLEEHREHFDDQGHLVEVHLLTRIENRPGGGGKISVEDGWMRTQLTNGLEQDPSPLILSEPDERNGLASNDD